MQDRKASIEFIETCYQLYEQKMYQVAYRILHDSGLAEDAVQEAFLKLMQSNIYFDDPRSDDSKRYMITVVKHSSINIYNKKKKEQQIICFPKDDVSIDNVAGQDDTGTNIDIEELVSGLPSKYYAVVHCLAIKNLSVKETAAELGITQAAVRKRFERAKRMLKTMQKGCEGYGAGNKLYRSNSS